jgi:pimeloyl-ACP methyl ester carboxylesterase
LTDSFDAGDVRLSVLDRGQGPVICFSHGLLFRKEMYAAQIDALSGDYRCVAWDHRGQGDSATPPGRIATIEQCTADAIALIESLDVGAVHFVGLSMGGFVGMRIAARRPDLIQSLVLLETAADTEPIANQRKYRRLNFAARLFGITGWLSGRVEPIVFGKTFLNSPDRAGEVEQWRGRLMANGRRVYKAVNGVIERDACLQECAQIRAPVLHIHGEEDVAITEERARRTSDAIPGATFEILPAMGHSASIEQPELVTSRIRAFVDAHSTP